MGRPTTHTVELAAEVCRRIAVVGSLRKVCAAEDMPPESTVREWVVDDREGFAAQYARAKDFGLDSMADDMIEIADTVQIGVKETDKENKFGDQVTEVTRGDMTEHRKLRVDVRKWYLSKIAPKRYGERMAHEVSGPDGGPIEIDDATRAAKIEAIFAAAARNRDTGSDLV